MSEEQQKVSGMSAVCAVFLNVHMSNTKINHSLHL